MGEESYKDNYIDTPTKGEDGWYYCDELPKNITIRGFYRLDSDNTVGINDVT